MNKPQPTELAIFGMVIIIHITILAWANQAPVTTPPQSQTNTSMAGQLITPTTAPASPSHTPAIPKKVPQAKSEASKHQTLAHSPVTTKNNPRKEESLTETGHTAQSATDASTEKPTTTETTPSFTQSNIPSTPAQNNNIGTTTPPKSDAQHFNNPAPTYPALSRRLGEQGHVLLNVHILANGSVNQINIRTSSGHPRLDEAALTAVKRWTYIPAKRGDQAIDYWYVQPISFVLN